MRNYLAEIANELKKNDPVRGRWDVSGSQVRLWVDASMLALGVALEVGGSIIKDGAWLRPDEARHINMAELDAVIKGLNLAIAWRMKEIELMTDSATVHRWIEDALSGRARLRTKAANEMLIRRRIETVLALIKEYDLAVTVTLVRSSENKADRLTRVPKRWLASAEPIGEEVCATADDTPLEQLIAEVHHASGHPGVRRTLYFSSCRDPRITKRDVSRVVSTCDISQSIDPAPVKWRHGVLEVPTVGQRVGIDVAHCGRELYLTLTDCGPSRFSIWRRLCQRSSAEIARQLESIFLERGAPNELLADNDTAFRSREVATLAERWGTCFRFRCAYAPSGNGITERCHRTVKVIAARTGCSVREAVYRYNLMPRDDRTPATAPANAIYRYTVQDQNEMTFSSTEESADCPYRIGESVWVKPRGGRCDDRYESGIVTGLISEQAVNGIPRHVRDIRRRGSGPNPPTNLSSDAYDDGGPIAPITGQTTSPGMIVFSNVTEPRQAESFDAEQSREQVQVALRRSARRRCQLQDCSAPRSPVATESDTRSRNAGDAQIAIDTNEARMRPNREAQNTLMGATEAETSPAAAEAMAKRKLLLPSYEEDACVSDVREWPDQLLESGTSLSEQEMVARQHFQLGELQDFSSG
ncbi:integrase core domain protein [Trichuris suis]|nr:integrase core domain protein [Trichuris suis]